MLLKSVLDWLDVELSAGCYSADISNNGLQIAREGEEINAVAFAVDGSAASVDAAKAFGAQLLVVHHGISWGNGIRRLTGGVYQVVRRAMSANLALAAYHLPLDAHPEVGNNAQLAKALAVSDVKKAFAYRGCEIGLIGTLSSSNFDKLRNFAPESPEYPITGFLAELARKNQSSLRLGICSGGGGSFVEEAAACGCDALLTGEADWGERIGAENLGLTLLCAGHYHTETFGIKALMARFTEKFANIAVKFVGPVVMLALAALSMFGGDLHAADNSEISSASAAESEWFASVSPVMAFSQGGRRFRHLGGINWRLGRNITENSALEAEVGVLENRVGMSANWLVHFNAWREYDMLFGYSRFDPFFTLGVAGILTRGQVGPEFGLGFLWYLDDYWAIRLDSRALVGLEHPMGMNYSLALGVQYTF